MGDDGTDDLLSDRREIRSDRTHLLIPSHHPQDTLLLPLDRIPGDEDEGDDGLTGTRTRTGSFSRWVGRKLCILAILRHWGFPPGVEDFLVVIGEALILR